MTTVEITLPDALAQEAASAGLLAPATIEQILRDRLRQERIDRTKAARATLAARPIDPMTPAEIDAEINAYRTAQRVLLVLDTNTALSGLLWGGNPGRLIDAAVAGRIELASSAPLLAELQGVLSRPKFGKQLARRGLTVADLFDGYAALVLIVTPAAIRPTIAQDPADDQVLATALSARAGLIVSGDADLLDLKQFHGIAICNAATAVRQLPPGSRD